jgi:hypothetical protein
MMRLIIIALTVCVAACAEQPEPAIPALSSPTLESPPPPEAHARAKHLPHDYILRKLDEAQDDLDKALQP